VARPFSEHHLAQSPVRCQDYGDFNDDGALMVSLLAHHTRMRQGGLETAQFLQLMLRQSVGQCSACGEEYTKTTQKYCSCHKIFITTIIL